MVGKRLAWARPLPHRERARAARFAHPLDLNRTRLVRRQSAKVRKPEIAPITCEPPAVRVCHSVYAITQKAWECRSGPHRTREFRAVRASAASVARGALIPQKYQIHKRSLFLAEITDEKGGRGTRSDNHHVAPAPGAARVKSCASASSSPADSGNRSGSVAVGNRAAGFATERSWRSLPRLANSGRSSPSSRG
jgi:hypothetical protein